MTNWLFQPVFVAQGCDVFSYQVGWAGPTAGLIQQYYAQYTLNNKTF